MRDFIESKSSYIYVFLLSGIFLFIGCFFILSSSLEVVRYNNQLNLQSKIDYAKELEDLQEGVGFSVEGDNETVNFDDL